MSTVSSLAELARHSGYIAQLQSQGDIAIFNRMLESIPPDILADAVFDNMARLPNPEAVGAQPGVQSGVHFAKLLKVMISAPGRELHQTVSMPSMHCDSPTIC